jgi:hypothetical protein
MRFFSWLAVFLAMALPLASCSNNNGNGDKQCTTPSDCSGLSLPDDCSGYWECVDGKCEPICTKGCTAPADCEGEDWPASADCERSQGQWKCEQEICRASCPVLTWSNRMEVDLEDAGIQLDLSASPDGNFAIAYYKRYPDPSTCEQPILGGPPTVALQDTIGYAWYDGSNWNREDVVTIETAMLSGITLIFQGNNPMIGYLGGAEGLQICGGSDMMISSGGPGNWNHSAAVVTSNEAAAGADCPKMQSICDFGDVVGLWPSLAKSQDGSIIGVTYRDIHNGYTKDADDCADLEYAYTSGGGWNHEWIDLARGSGDFSSLAFGNDGEPAVAYYNGEVGTGGEGVILFAKRPWAEWTQPLKPPCDTAADCPNGQACAGGECLCNTDSQCDSPKRCVESRCSAVIDTIAGGLDEKSISLAVGPDGRYLVAYYNPDDQNLWIAHSDDGLAWQKGIVDADGNTGMYPSIVILPNTNKPAIAYYRCNVYRPNETTCDRNQDGPRFAYFKGEYPLDLTTQSKWKKGYISETGNPDSVATDGRHISLAVLPDGTVGVAYYYNWLDPSAGKVKEHLMFHRGTWE